MIAPTLRTARLRLDAHVADDLPALAAMWADPLVTRHIGGRPATREESWQRLLRYRGHWVLLPYGFWAIRDAQSGTLLGDAGLMDSRRATDPSFEGTPEVGWALASHAHGQGYAAEALGAILGWADAQGIARTVCIIDGGNARSIRLAERLGYRLVTEARYRDAPTLLFERLA